MEPPRDLEQTVTVLHDDVIQSGTPAAAFSLERITMALDAATNNLNDVRQALQRLSETVQDDNGAWLSDQPVLLTVPQVCELLGYHKTKVYGLMKRGLLPYLLDRRTGRRRIEYRAVQRFVKRLRARRLERSAS